MVTRRRPGPDGAVRAAEQRRQVPGAGDPGRAGGQVEQDVGQGGDLVRVQVLGDPVHARSARPRARGRSRSGTAAWCASAPSAPRRAAPCPSRRRPPGPRGGRPTSTQSYQSPPTSQAAPVRATYRAASVQVRPARQPRGQQRLLQGAWPRWPGPRTPGPGRAPGRPGPPCRPAAPLHRRPVARATSQATRAAIGLPRTVSGSAARAPTRRRICAAASGNARAPPRAVAEEDTAPRSGWTRGAGHGRVPSPTRSTRAAAGRVVPRGAEQAQPAAQVGDDHRGVRSARAIAPRRRQGLGHLGRCHRLGQVLGAAQQLPGPGQRGAQLALAAAELGGGVGLQVAPAWPAPSGAAPPASTA